MRHVGFLCGAVLLLAFCAGGQTNAGGTYLFGPSVSAFATGAPALSIPAEPPQGVYGVLPNYPWQVYAGVTFLRFYELPGLTGNMDGFNFSVVYYPHSGRLGVDGEFATGYAPQNGVNTQLAFVLGGARFRLARTQGLELWVHGLAGGAKFVPQTAFGGTGALAFALGGGIDYNPRHRRLGYRVQADLDGTRFFGTHQYGPKLSIGLVYNL
ncbi:MAG TPA: hypothetical protein VJO53_07220 [Candidatus Acidoferrales bacterium]|nr:hypothetical protein [Candidatus Acidoferrales bacterium]